MSTTIAQTVAWIREGWDPWRSLNEFLHGWYESDHDERTHLISEPLVVSDDHCNPMSRWALFCVGVVEHLCHEASLPLPTWMSAITFVLPQAWYPEEGVDSQPRLRRSVQQATPPAF